MKTEVYHPDGRIELIPDPRPLYEQKADAMERAAAARWDAAQAFTFNGLPGVACDDLAQGRLTSTVTALSLPQVPVGTAIGWEMAPGTFVQLDLQAAQLFAIAMMQHVQGCWARYAEISAGIEAAPDPDALDAIDLSAGWPT